jgi:hypothetical protein
MSIFLMFITCTIRWDGRPRLVTALDAAALRRRIAGVLNAQQACLHDTVGAALPALNQGLCIINRLGDPQTRGWPRSAPQGLPAAGELRPCQSAA